MSRELATVFVQFIPAGNWQWDQDNFDYLIIGDMIVEAHNHLHASDEHVFKVDAYGIGLHIIGLQSSEVESEYDSSSILRCIYDGNGPCGIYDENTTTRFVEIAQALRVDNHRNVSFVVTFDCGVTEDSDTWVSGFVHGEPYADVTHYCNSNTLEWGEIK